MAMPTYTALREENEKEMYCADIFGRIWTFIEYNIRLEMKQKEKENSSDD